MPLKTVIPPPKKKKWLAQIKKGYIFTQFS